MSNNAVRALGSAVAAIGLVLMVALWFLACAAGAWHLFNLLEVSSAGEATALLWPFVVMAIGGPLVAILAVGGLQFVRNLLDMREMINGLPKQAEAMQGAVSKFGDMREMVDSLPSQAQAMLDAVGKFREHRDAMEKMTEQFSIEKGQLLADLRANEQKRDERPEDSSSPALETLMDLYGHAQQLLYSAVYRHNAEVEEEEKITLHPGDANYKDVIKKLLAKSNFRAAPEENVEVANFVDQVFSLERRTRGAARRNLSLEEVRKINKPAPAKYKRVA